MTLLCRVAAARADGGGFVDLAGARAVDLSVNIQSACAVTDAGRLICWGNNSHGALGPVRETDRLPPTLRPDITDAARVFLADSGGCVARRSGAIIAARGSRLCGVFTEGRVFCPPSAADWKYLSSPTSFVPIGAALSLAVANRQACAILASRQVGCWGENAYGQLGTGKLGPWPPAAPPPTIEPIAGLDRIVALSVGEYHACQTTGAV